uniref:CUB domain-containing protein n=1 Tax=Hydatigena taeniaeformis TaxID=6205 RepID=A0A158REF1_HYDTA
LYICMRFQILNRTPPTEVFELIQGKFKGLLAEYNASSFYEDNESNLSKYLSGHRRSRCPIVGGFQAKNFMKIRSKSQICASSVYVTIDSECIRGEGIELHFNEVGCNPFEPALVTKFVCFVQWAEMGSVNTILVKEKSSADYIVASMFYQDPPTQVDTVNNEYGSFTKIYIGLGIFRPMAQSTKDGANVAYPAYLYDLQPFDTALKTSPAAFYEVQMRGAFGTCDDELEQCERGCNADARNRLFCRRSCPSVRKECSMAHSDSCEINASYRGLWLLIDPLPGGSEQSEQHRHTRRLINISDRTVTFANVLGDETFYEFSCLREASEIVPDWYILGGRQLQPGCHPRDVCLEVYQNRPIFSNEAPNTNTLLFRLCKSSLFLFSWIHLKTVNVETSNLLVIKMNTIFAAKSEKQGVDISNLCTFPDDPRSTKQRRAQVLVKQVSHRGPFGSPHEKIFNASKCEIYQIKLRGSIRLRAQFFSNLIVAQAARQFDAFAEQNGVEKEAKNHFVWSRKDTTFLPEMVSCAIELSDFNPQLGTTGEFDGFLRLKSSCSVDPFSRFTNNGKLAFVLLAKNILGGRSFNNKWGILVIQESEVEGKPTFNIYLFLTPQCQYEENAFGEILINNSSAVAIMHVVAGKEPSCLLSLCLCA